jgi:hypothetical protein
MKRRLLVFVCLALAAGMVFAGEENQEPWRGKMISTSYGVSILNMEIWGGGAGHPLLGPELRLFIGNSLSHRSGFYHGIEIGTLFFIPEDHAPGEVEGFADSYVGAVTTDYTVTVRYSLSMAFALAKYGYRWDIGSRAHGIGFAAELGIGARIAEGNFQLEAGDISGYWDSANLVYWDSGVGSLGLMMDAAGEFSFRLSDKFRFFLRPGLMFINPFLSAQEGHDAWNHADSQPPDGISNGIDSFDEALALVSKYEVRLSNVIFSARLGFTINY